MYQAKEYQYLQIPEKETNMSIILISFYDQINVNNHSSHEP